MDRRRFVLTSLAGALAAPLAAEAQSGVRMSRIAYLGQSTPGIERRLLDAFQQRLRDLGYIEGRTLVIE